MSNFLSGSGENKTGTSKVKGSKSIRFKEEVVAQLVRHFDVPNRAAEISVIDFRYQLNIGYHNKTSTYETAKLMVPLLDAYKSNGNWPKSLI